jgi:glycosyl transferase family 25
MSARKTVQVKVKTFMIGVSTQVRNESKYLISRFQNKMTNFAYTRKPTDSWEDRALVVYINLRHRTDRAEQILRQFSIMRIRNPIRYEGIVEENGALGCSKSHLEVLRMAMELDLDLVMICEDDIKFCLSRRRLDIIIREFENNSELDALCLGYNLGQKPKPISNRFLHTMNTSTTSCYILKKKIVPEMLEIAEESVKNLTENPSDPSSQIDQLWKVLQQKRMFVVTNKRLVYQRNSYSDILKKNTRYGL